MWMAVLSVTYMSYAQLHLNNGVLASEIYPSQIKTKQKLNLSMQRENVSIVNGRVDALYVLALIEAA